DPRYRRGTACERSGLIENHHVQIAGTFERQPILDEETILGSEGCRDCNHKWNRQSQGVRAGNNEDGCRPNQSVLFVSCKPPVSEGGRARRDCHVEKTCGGPV